MSRPNRLSVICVPAFADNYLWIIHRDGLALVVDPGDAQAVQQQLDAHGLKLAAILLTHHHPDHVGGVEALRGEQRIPVYGPAAEQALISAIDHPVGEGRSLELLGETVTVMATPGHTLGHVVYYFASEQTLFCGDTLFSAGCGRLFEGSPAQMLESLRRLRALPASTRVYCAHEYTLSNLAFAAAVEPANPAVAAHIAGVRQLREQGLASIPSQIDIERQINPFLRIEEPMVRHAIEVHLGATPADDVAYFAALRAWKDHFRPPTAT